MIYVTNRDNSQRSGPHRRVEQILDTMGISYISEHPFPPYTVDIYLPEWRLGIEIDGPLHSKAKDKVRDNYLDAWYQVPILRLDAKRWHKRTNIQSQIVAFIELHAESTDDRKANAPR